MQITITPMLLTPASEPKAYISAKEKTIIYCVSHTTAGAKQGLIKLQLQFSIYYNFLKK